MLKRAFLATLLFVVTLPALAQQRYANELAQLEAFIAETMQRTQMPALSVAIRKDDFVWAKGFGLADVENRVPAKAESSYRTGSIAKPMTAVAVMKLVELGKIDLDAEVQKYVPSFPKKQHPVTVRQLLGHLGGISHYRNYVAEGRIKEPKTTKEALAIFADWELVNEPGTAYSYTSYGYNLLGAVIEGASGQPYGDFMREQVWGPLGMTNTLLDNPRAIVPNRVRGYSLVRGKLQNSEFVDISSRFAGGGARSTVVDLLKFMEGVEAGKVVKPETVQQMWTNQTTKGGTFIRYGLGFGLEPHSGRFSVEHSGAQQETRTDMGLVPRAKLAWAVMTNFEDASLDPIAERIAAIFLGDSWNANPYANGPDARKQLEAIGSTYNFGFAHYDRFGSARTNDAKELADAFRYFNRALTGEEKLARDGRHPVTGEPFVKVGSYIARELAKSGADVEQLHRDGPFAFFDDYVKLYKRNRSIPRTHRFDPAFETTVAQWRADWQRIWTDDLKRFAIHGPADIDRLERELKPRFANASIYPNYAGSLVALGEDAEGAELARIAKLGLELYPDNEVATGFAGVVAVASGEVERGKELLTKSRAMNPEGFAGKRNLAQVARFFEQQGNKTAAAILRAF